MYSHMYSRVHIYTMIDIYSYMYTEFCVQIEFHILINPYIQAIAIQIYIYTKICIYVEFHILIDGDDMHKKMALTGLGMTILQQVAIKRFEI